jgi:hypothetical protein
MTRFVITPAVAFVVAMVAGACGPGQLDEVEDLTNFTEEVQRICADLCEVNLACIEMSAFESQEACEHACPGFQFIQNDSTCGEAKRALLECVGSQPTCELFFDTFNVFADEYPCQAERERWIEIGEACLASEDPYPKEEP